MQMRLRWCLFYLTVSAAFSFYCLSYCIAQEVRPRTVGRDASGRGALSADEVLRVKTRVVFIDTLVKDSKTNEPVRDLKREDFQVLDNGRPRKLSYFTREGDSRRPLAMMLFIDLWTPYGRSNLKSVEAMRRLASALSNLAPEDKVAVMVTWIEEGDPPGTAVPKTRMIDDFTTNRESTRAALLSVPSLVARQERLVEEIANHRTQAGGDPMLDVVWRLSELAGEIIPMSLRFPGSQFVVVGLIADLFDLKKNEREEAAERALRAGITFYALVFKKGVAAKIFFGTFNKIFMSTRGMSLHAADYLAEQTGGEVAGVGRPIDLATGLEGFIRSLMARYNLGFTLDEQEQDDGRLHLLEVNVKAKDAQGKQRKLLVNARRGYYMRMTP